MLYINLTPHEVRIFGSDPQTGEPTAEPMAVLPPSGKVARITVEDLYAFTDIATGIEHYGSIAGEPQDLPDPHQGVVLVVSALVRTALPERPDLASPGRLIRNEAGQPIGCVGLYINRQS